VIKFLRSIKLSHERNQQTVNSTDHWKLNC